jgi:hypothetical protein
MCSYLSDDDFMLRNVSTTYIYIIIFKNNLDPVNKI